VQAQRKPTYAGEPSRALARAPSASRHGPDPASTHAPITSPTIHRVAVHRIHTGNALGAPPPTPRNPVPALSGRVRFPDKSAGFRPLPDSDTARAPDARPDTRPDARPDTRSDGARRAAPRAASAAC